jgi:hypothetical protein
MRELPSPPLKSYVNLYFTYPVHGAASTLPVTSSRVK